MTGHETDNDVMLLRELDKQLGKNPNNVRLLLEKGFLLMEPFHDTDASLALFRRAVELEPNNVDALFWLAKSLYHDHFQEQEPRALLERALNVDPCRADVHDFLASVLNDLGVEPEVSIAHLKQAISLEPSWILPRIRLSYYFVESNDLSAAERMAKEVFKIFQVQKKCTPKTPIEKYYEYCITGRASCTKEKMDRLFMAIEKAKHAHAKQD